MKDDIRPLSKKDPESPDFRPKKDFNKKPGEPERPAKEKTEGKKNLSDQKVKHQANLKSNPNSSSKVSTIARENKEKLKKEKRRAQLKAQEKLNHRPDLTFFWGLISLVVVGSLVVLGYYVFSNNQQAGEDKNLKQVTKEEPTQSENQIALKGETYYYLTGNDEQINLVKGHQGVENQQTTITNFIPPADLDKVSASWDGGHKFVFVSSKGVELYNHDKETTSLLAPNRGDREYYYVNFSTDEKIACLYSKLEDSYLEVYSSSLKLLNKKIPADQIGWTDKNQLSYLNIDKEKEVYEFKIYNEKEKEYVSYFDKYIGKSRYPIAFSNSKTSAKTAFLLRDSSGAKSALILSIGDHNTKKLNKISELLYLNSEIEDSSIVRPTIVWDKKEDFLYVSINNQNYKVDTVSGETEELDLDIEGTIEAISQDNKYLYIRKANQENGEFEKPESVIIYDQGTKEISEQSGLAQICKYLNYNYWNNN
jgi:hypothetical protein